MPTTQVGSHTVYYDEYGTGHPVLFLTGLGGTRHAWWKQIDFYLALGIILMSSTIIG